MSERLAEMVRRIPLPAFNYGPCNTHAEYGFQRGLNAAADLIANSPELAEMRRDAERYRHVRQNFFVVQAGEKRPGYVFPNVKMLTGNELDAAIDAAQLGEG